MEHDGLSFPASLATPNTKLTLLPIILSYVLLSLLLLFHLIPLRTPATENTNILCATFYQGE